MRWYSLETRWLQAGHAQAMRDLTVHRKWCVDCLRAARKRKPEERCAEGVALGTAETELYRQAREAERLDLLPHPDQEPLFAVSP